MQYGNTSVATKPTNSVPANIYNKILLSGKSYFHTPSPLRGYLIYLTTSVNSGLASGSLPTVT